MHLEKIRTYLISKINIFYILISDDSKFHQHNKNILTHLKIIIVSDDFVNKKTIIRHRLIFKKLYEIHKEKIYSITLYTYTLNEWKYKKNRKIDSVKCLKQL